MITDSEGSGINSASPSASVVLENGSTMMKQVDVKNFVRCTDGASRKFIPLTWDDGVAEHKAAWDHMHNSPLALNLDYRAGSVVWNEKRIVGFKRLIDNSFTAY
jgi:hypothetical protein